MKTGRIENQYTPAYREQLQKEKQHQMLESDQRTKMGKASKGHLEDMLKDMPDGEYLSDGSQLMPAEAGVGEALEKQKAGV
jgi:hypothetical protein